MYVRFFLPKKCLFAIIFGLFFGSRAFALTDPSVKYPDLDLYLEDKSLVRTAPDRFNPKNIALAPEDIAYWKKVLPFEQDRYADMYLVIPQLGLITPIQHIPRESGDRTSMVNGREISLNKYLQGGIIEYAGSVAPGHLGKRIDFGHSNYYATDPGRYKTIFANLMWLDPKDEVWYFVRNGDQYTLHKYAVTDSYPTSPGNTAALARDGQGADTLIFGCYHGLQGRRMIEATYLGTPLASPDMSGEDPYAQLSPHRKARIDAGMYKLERMALKWRKANILALYSRLKKYQETNELTQQEALVVAYMIDGFGRLYE